MNSRLPPPPPPAPEDGSDGRPMPRSPVGAARFAAAGAGPYRRSQSSDRRLLRRADRAIRHGHSIELAAYRKRIGIGKLTPVLRHGKTRQCSMSGTARRRMEGGRGVAVAFGASELMASRNFSTSPLVLLLLLLAGLHRFCWAESRKRPTLIHQLPTGTEEGLL
uniref:Uncharacterized protein n=1 Tax=Macrostomum lignano TaxID=282301 RepID=A0A1I8FQJ5_9PLAT